MTVVIPSYQPGPYLEPAVRSTLLQNPAPAEVVVIDDGSTDGAAEALQALDLPQVRIIRQDNAGEGAARNTGLRHASHEWVALLDADDWWLPGHLAAVWPHRDGRSFISTTMVGSAGGRVFGSATGRMRALPDAMSVVWPDNPVTSSGVLVRRDVALEVGGFSNRRRAADLEMWLRLVRVLPGLSLPEVTCVYRQHPNQVSSDKAQMWSALREVVSSSVRPEEQLDLLLRRVDARIAWDEARAQQRAGRLSDAARLLPRLVGAPTRVAAIAQTLHWRAAARRRGREQAKSLHVGGGLTKSA